MCFRRFRICGSISGFVGYPKEAYTHGMNHIFQQNDYLQGLSHYPVHLNRPAMADCGALAIHHLLDLICNQVVTSLPRLGSNRRV